MTDSIIGGGTGQDWERLVEAAYDRAANYYLRPEPRWRQVIDMYPVEQAMPGKSVTLTIHQAFASLATTPLSELVDVSASAATAPNRVVVTLEEFGFAAINTLYLNKLAFTKPDRELAELVGRHRDDSVDAIIRSVADTSTNTLSRAGGTMQTGADVDTIVAANTMDRHLATVPAKLLRRRSVVPKVGPMYLGMIHPDVSYDIQTEDSASAWRGPHVEGTDTAAIYNGDIGAYMSVQWIETPRVTVATNANAAPTDVYNSYVLGRGALVEASEFDPHIVIGPQVDHLRRFYPIGWYALFGHALYRPEAMEIVQTSSSISTLA